MRLAGMKTVIAASAALMMASQTQAAPIAWQSHWSMRFSRDAGDTRELQRARQTLDANLRLIDPVWGGVYQYSDEVDWQSRHYEKLIEFQANDLKLYSEAYARWKDPRYFAAAQSFYHYLSTTRRPEQNAALVRVASLMHHYTGDARYERTAKHAMKFLLGFAKAAPEQGRAEILLADRELATAPIHITIVGGKSDPSAREFVSATGSSRGIRLHRHRMLDAGVCAG
jgi:uncharacterized protein YyaL (SSP411 family)